MTLIVYGYSGIQKSGILIEYIVQGFPNCFILANFPILRQERVKLT